MKVKMVKNKKREKRISNINGKVENGNSIGILVCTF